MSSLNSPEFYEDSEAIVNDNGNVDISHEPNFLVHKMYQLSPPEVKHFKLSIYLKKCIISLIINIEREKRDTNKIRRFVLLEIT